MFINNNKCQTKKILFTELRYDHHHGNNTAKERRLFQQDYKYTKVSQPALWGEGSNRWKEYLREGHNHNVSARGEPRHSGVLVKPGPKRSVNVCSKSRWHYVFQVLLVWKGWSQCKGVRVRQTRLLPFGANGNWPWLDELWLNLPYSFPNPLSSKINGKGTLS